MKSELEKAAARVRKAQQTVTDREAELASYREIEQTAKLAYEEARRNRLDSEAFLVAEKSNLEREKQSVSDIVRPSITLYNSPLFPNRIVAKSGSPF